MNNQKDKILFSIDSECAISLIEKLGGKPLGHAGSRIYCISERDSLNHLCMLKLLTCDSKIVNLCEEDLLCLENTLKKANQQ